MRRVQFIELHEQPWFPSSLRDDVTDAVQFGFNLLKAYAPIAPLLQKMIDWICVLAEAVRGSTFLESSSAGTPAIPRAFRFGSRTNIRISRPSKISAPPLVTTFLTIRNRWTQ